MGCRSYLPDGSAHDAVVRFIKKIIVVEMPMGKNKTRKRESYFFRFFRFFGSKFGNFLGIWEHTDFFGNLGAYRGIGAAEGGNIGKGGKIRSGGLH